MRLPIGPAIFLFAAACFFLPAGLLAQLSPGDLSRPHAGLEGLNNCTKCHAAGDRIDRGLCLDCHSFMKERIEKGLGLHARPEYQQCVDCHTDHHGREFNLVFWKEGRDKFDHGQTGYRLEGAHETLACRDCHRPGNHQDPQRLTARQKNLERTFLGLSQRCLSCHRDEHRGQLAAACRECHSMEHWTPAPRFDHDQARFRLTGRHQGLECLSCHPAASDRPLGEDLSYRRFRDLEFQECSACHSDVHQGRLGASCRSCHNSSGWEVLASAGGFDHDRTRFPLKGRHATLKCEVCHRPGRAKRGLQFGTCRDCHGDFHRGQFADRSSGGACRECHTEEGFSPSLFTLASHQKTAFPLEGSHLAIPCFACHQEGETPQNGQRSMLPLNRFVFASLACGSCHRDPHLGQVAAWMRDGDCRGCHTLESWKTVSFDHASTGFELQGRHRRAACATCHTRQEIQPGGFANRFKGLSSQCLDCHEDPHFGQFQAQTVSQGRTVQITDCGRCHSPEGWSQGKFDHARQARFALDGAHEAVPCAACHPRETQGARSFVRYKPLKSDCSACHGGLN